MIQLDTSARVDALSGPGPSAARLRQSIADGERLAISSIVLYEWVRGRRVPEQLAAQEVLFPAEAAVPFGVPEATLAASMDPGLRGSQRRSVDVAVVARALSHGAVFWTLHSRDFADLPGLDLA